MRLPLVPKTALTAEQRPLYEDMRKGIEANFKGFVAINGAGQLIGPWNPWLRYSKFGGPVWELVKALSTAPTLPKPVREVAILVTGALSLGLRTLCACVGRGASRHIRREDRHDRRTVTVPWI